LFRMGTESRGLLLGRGIGERSPRQDPGQFIPGRPGVFQAPFGEHADGRLHAGDRAGGRSAPPPRHVRLMVVRVLAVGKIRDPTIRTAWEDYLGRSQRYLRIEVREVTTRSRGKTPGEVLRAEGTALLRALSPDSNAIALTRAGTMESSTRFAR